MAIMARLSIRADRRRPARRHRILRLVEAGVGEDGPGRPGPRQEAARSRTAHHERVVNLGEDPATGIFAVTPGADLVEVVELPPRDRLDAPRAAPVLLAGSQPSRRPLI